MLMKYLDLLTEKMKEVGKDLPVDVGIDVRKLSIEYERVMRDNPNEASALLEPKAREILRRIDTWLAKAWENSSPADPPTAYPGWS